MQEDLLWLYIKATSGGDAAALLLYISHIGHTLHPPDAVCWRASGINITSSRSLEVQYVNTRVYTLTTN